jgi:clathrin heavy chain
MQPLHSVTVNNALHELLLAEQDLPGLKTALAVSDKYDVSALAQRLAANPRRDFRNLAIQLYRTHKQPQPALQLLLGEGRYQEAIDLAAEARDRHLSELLLNELAVRRLPVLFLGACYGLADSLVSDVVVELAWRNGWMDIVMPVVCQMMRDAEGKDGGPGLSRTTSRLSFSMHA